MMSPAEILARLQESFSVLAGGSRSSEGRHETLTTAIDWSYWLLSEEEQRLLRCLSVFFGGFTLDALSAVFGESSAPAVDLLAQLIDKSLVAPQETADGATRYALLETVREYGHRKLRENGEHEDVHGRHGEYFAKLVEASRGKINGPDRGAWLERLGADVDNLRAVFELGAVSPATALAMAATLSDFWEARGDYSEARTRLDALLARSSEPSLARVEAIQAAGMMAWSQGDLTAAVDYTTEGLRLSRQIGNPEQEALMLQQLAQIATQQGDFKRARPLVEEALEISTKHRFEQIQALCEWRLGFIALFSNDLDGADGHFRTSVDLWERLGDSQSLANSEAMRGIVALRQARLEDAKVFLIDSLQLQRLEGASRSVANLLETLAAVAADEGENDRALRLGGAAQGLRDRIHVVTESPLSREIISRLEPLRHSAGGDQAWKSGLAMSREDAIAYALGESVLSPT
jgi:tetratricopeptide (TPR) repeat protein